MLIKKLYLPRLRALVPWAALIGHSSCKLRRVSGKAMAGNILQTTLALGALVVSTACFADEPYAFHRVVCDDVIPAFEIEKVTYYNIRHVVWPAAAHNNDSWAAHVESLKALEARSQLYVFDEWFGYHNGSTSLAFSCGDLSAKFEFEAATREEGPVGSGEAVRMSVRLSVESKNGLIVENIWLRSVQELRVYGSEENIVLCGYDTCQQGLVSSFEVVRTDKLQRRKTQ